MNWREWLRNLAREPYFMPPHVAGELTVYQARMLVASEADASGKVKGQTKAEADTQRKFIAEQFDDVITNLLQGRHWDETGI